MPANLTPDFKAAEAAYRKAKDGKERLDCLREMLRTIPKHKGTDHLQADIKTRIKQLTEELSGPKKGAASGGPITVIRPEGAAQIALIGPPNVGKSALHAQLTGSHAEVAPYPFTTRFPLPGMLPYEDIYFQLIDLPAISAEHPVPWITNALQPADACLLVVDLEHTECVEEVLDLIEILKQKRITLIQTWRGRSDESAEAGENDLPDPFAIVLPTLMVANKADRIPALDDELQVFGELTGLNYPVRCLSALRGDGLSEIGPWLFDHLGVVRVYTKAPGRPPDRDRPFTVLHGQTVADVAMQVHRDIAGSLKYARIWGEGQFDGQQVGRDHVVGDGDILEIHT